MSVSSRAQIPYFQNDIHDSTERFRALDSKGNDVITPSLRGLLKTRFRERAHGLYPPDKGGQGGWFPAEGGRAGRVKYYSLRLPPSFLAMNAPSPVAFDPQPPLSGGLFQQPRERSVCIVGRSPSTRSRCAPFDPPSSVGSNPRYGERAYSG